MFEGFLEWIVVFLQWIEIHQLEFIIMLISIPIGIGIILHLIVRYVLKKSWPDVFNWTIQMWENMKNRFLQELEDLVTFLDPVIDFIFEQKRHILILILLILVAGPISVLVTGAYIIFFATFASYLIYRVFEVPKKSPDVHFFEFWLFSLVIAFFATGNVRVALNFLLILLIYRMILAFINYYLNSAENREHLTNTLIATGAMIFGIMTYLIGAPVFVFDGTNTCETSYPVIIDSDTNNFTVSINGLKARHSGDRMGQVQVITKIISNPSIISCRGCSSGPYPKPDGSNNSIHEVNVDVNFESDVNEFEFIQQVNQSDHLLAVMSGMKNIVRNCACEVLRDANGLVEEVKCEREPVVKDIFAETYFFEPS